MQRPANRLIDPGFANVGGELEDWQKCALERHDLACHRKAAQRKGRQRNTRVQDWRDRRAGDNSMAGWRWENCASRD